MWNWRPKKPLLPVAAVPKISFSHLSSKPNVTSSKIITKHYMTTVMLSWNARFANIGLKNIKLGMQYPHQNFQSQNLGLELQYSWDSVRITSQQSLTYVGAVHNSNLYLLGASTTVGLQQSHYGFLPHDSYEKLKKRSKFNSFDTFKKVVT